MCININEPLKNVMLKEKKQLIGEFKEYDAIYIRFLNIPNNIVSKAFICSVSIKMYAVVV